MTKPNDPAFNGEIYNDSGIKLIRETGINIVGLTKREYFAGLAMLGLLAGSEGKVNWTEKQFSIGAINLADALIAELSKTE